APPTSRRWGLSDHIAVSAHFDFDPHSSSLLHRLPETEANEVRYRRGAAIGDFNFFLQDLPDRKFGLANRSRNQVWLLRSHRQVTERPARDVAENRSGNDATIDIDLRLIDEDQGNQFGRIRRDKPDKRPYPFRGGIAPVGEIRLLRRACLSRHLKSFHLRHNPGTAFIGNFL